MPCAACTAELPAGARFCPACGSPVALPDPAGETRKVVTVVFCDLVGSTSLSGRLDPETLRSIVLRYFELMSGCIQAHGGTVEKFIGDAVMAVFGVPVMREDDACRAASAALDMIDSLATLNADLAVQFGVQLDVRIGVNTGEVVAAADASVRQALVSGEVVNLAARLEQHAPPGTVLIGPQTREAAGGALVVEAVDALRVKGKDTPIGAYRLVRVRPDEPELVRRFDLPFVGREPERAELGRIADRVRTGGRSRLVVIHGDAGLGKTRLVRQWLSGAGMAVGSGRCRAYRDRGTLAPLAESVRQLLDDGAALAAVTADPVAVTALRTVQSGLFATGMPNPTVADTCVAVAAVIRGVARSRPVVIAIDDCHWADPTLLEVVDRLAAAVAAAPVMVVCIGRPELLDRWSGGPDLDAGVDRMALGPLTRPQAATLARTLAVDLGQDSLDGVLTRAEGNPFLLEQLLIVAAEQGVSDHLPLTVRSLLAARIDALAPAERAALDRAAVIGRDFDLATLADLEPGGSSRQAVAGLARRRLVEAVPPGPDGFRFSSVLLHEVAYQAMPKRARAETHERLAAVVQSRGDDPAVVGGHLERAYRHRAELGRHDPATEEIRLGAAARLAEAGRRALAGADLSWAEDLLARVTALTGPADEAWLVAAQALGEVRIAVGRSVDGADLLRAALAVAEAGGNARAAAHARLQLSVLDPGPAMATAARVGRESIAVFTAAADHLGLARAYLRSAQEWQFLGRHAEAQRLLDVSFRHCERAGAEPERAMALGAMGISLWLGPVSAAAGIDRCLALLDGNGGNRAVVRLTLNCPLAVLLALQGRTAEAHRCLRAAAAVAGDLGYAETAWVLPIFTAQVQVMEGRLGDAERSLRDAIAAMTANRQPDGAALLTGAVRDLSRVLLRTGDHAAAARLAPPVAAGEAADVNADLCGIRARIEAAEGRSDRALPLADRAVAEAARTDSPVVRGLAALDLAEVCQLLALPDRAATAATAARQCFRAKGHLVGVTWAETLLTTARSTGKDTRT